MIFQGPEKVLVVYNENSEVSDSIRNHYIRVREIPESNVVPITLADPSGYGCEFRQNEEEIVDLSLPGDGGWHYIKEVIADEIINHLNNTYYEGQPLSNVIRYIVLCKGIPLKVRFADNLGWIWDSHTRNRVSVDALLCLINQPDGRSFVDLYGTLDGTYKNPYFNVDPRYTMNYRFVSNYFVNQQGWYMQYLVSRLDGDNLDEIISMIDRSAYPDLSSEKYWIIDDDPQIPLGSLEETHNRLSSLEFNLNPEVYVNSLEWITNNQPSGEEVIGYTSHGVHAGMPATYILNPLDFVYAHGAVFNSWESFNGNSYFQEHRGPHGLITDFIQMGGSAAVGNVYEPYENGIGNDVIIFPAYSLGYSLVDAVYQGISYIAWQNTIVGDPLTRIYQCDNAVISTNTSVGSGEYNCDLTVPLGITLTVESGAIINFNRNSEVKIFGTLILNDGSSLNLNGYSSLEINGNISVNDGTASVNFNQRSILDLKMSNHLII